MTLIKKLFTEELKKAGITVNGTQPYDIHVLDERVYVRVFLHGTLGFGEAYMDGWWTCEDMAGLTARVMRAGTIKHAQNFPDKVLSLTQKAFNLQSIEKATEVGEKHYDIGNDLYAAMLDKRLVYTCGYWRNAKTLDEAQEDKLRLICEKLSLKPGQRILGVGCGWGSFAKYAAEQYGVSVVGITISNEQLTLGKELCKGLPVDLRFLDYRDVQKEFPEPFDHIVSIGMFEHVGPKNYGVYMKTLSKVLKPAGLFLLHTIGGGGADPWFNKYIFPGGYLPRMEEIIQATRDTFVIEDWHNFGPDYDRTLSAWYENFNTVWPTLKATGKYDERFYRMWRFYLLSCAGSFRAREPQLWQVVLSPTGVSGGYKSIR